MKTLRIWLVRSLLALSTLLVLLVVTGFLLLTTGWGLGITTRMVNQLASSPDMSVELEGVTSLWGEVSIAGLRLADKNGPWLEASNLSARYGLMDLVNLDIKVDHISLANLSVLRAPLPSDREPAEPTDWRQTLASLEKLTISIDRIAVPSIALGEPLLGKAAQLSLEGSLSFDLASWRSAGSIDVTHHDQTDAGFSSRWDIAPEQNRQKIALRLIEPSGGLITRLLDTPDLPAIDIALEGDGPTDQWQSDLEVRLDAKTIVTGQMTIGLEGQQQSISAKLSGQLAPFLPESLNPLVAGSSNLDLQIEQTASGVTKLSRLTFSSALADFTSRGSIDRTKGEIDLLASFSLGAAQTEIEIQQTGVDPLHLGHLTLEGQIRGPLDGAALRLVGSLPHLAQGALDLEQFGLDIRSDSLDLLNQSGSLSGTLTLQELTTGSDDLDALIRGSKRLAFTTTIAAATAQLEEVQLQAGAVTAALSGKLDASDMDLEGSFALSDVSLFNPILAGGAQGRFALDGPVSTPTITASVDEALLSIDQQPVENLTLEMTAKPRADAASGQTMSNGMQAALSLGARYRGAPIRATVTLDTLPNGTRAISLSQFTAPGANLVGALQLTDNGLAEGSLRVDIADLEAFGPLLLQPQMTGSLKADIALSHNNAKQSLTLAATAPRIDHPAASLSGLAIDTTIADATGAMSLTGNLTLARLDASGQSLERVKADVSGQNGRLPFHVTATLANAPWQLSGDLVQQTDRTLLTLSDFSGNWNGIALGLTTPGQIALADTVSVTNPIRVNLDGGMLELSGTAADNLDLTIKASGLPIAMADKIAPTGEAPSGQLDVTARLSGTPDNPTVRWQGTLSNLSSNSTRAARLPAFAIATNGQLANQQITMENRLTGGGADLKANGSVALDRQTLDITLAGNVPFSLAASSLIETGLRLEGTGGLSARLSGPLTNPAINGTVTTQKARFTEFSSGLTISDINAAVDLDGQKASIKTLTGRLGRDGKLSVTGSIGLDANQGLPADIAIKIEDGTFQHEDLLTSQFSADMSLTGALLQRSTIAGGVTLNNTEIMIPETLPDSLSPLDVSHKNATGRVAEQAKTFAPKPQDTGSGQSSMILDLTISAPRRIYIRGRGMDSELGGTIRLTGTTADPTPVGTIQMQRGRIDILTKRLDFDTGSVTFAGSLDPSLNFLANTSSGGTTFTVAITGYASAPEISLSSSPALPEDEILAQLFFDRSLSSLSPLQLAQLANAIATLSGANSGPGLLDRLRNLAGIDNIDIKSDSETNETTVGVGRYINDRTYINVEKSTASEAGKVSIDLEITDTLKAHGEADKDGRTKAGIFFERDY